MQVHKLVIIEILIIKISCKIESFFLPYSVSNSFWNNFWNEEGRRKVRETDGVSHSLQKRYGGRRGRVRFPNVSW